MIRPGAKKPLTKAKCTDHADLARFGAGFLSIRCAGCGVGALND
jgi:hypothetical protein